MNCAFSVPIYFQCLQFKTMFERYLNIKIPIISVVMWVCVWESVSLISSINVNRPLFQWWMKMLAIFVLEHDMNKRKCEWKKEKCQRLETFASKILLLVFFGSHVTPVMRQKRTPICGKAPNETSGNDSTSKPMFRYLLEQQRAHRILCECVSEGKRALFIKIDGGSIIGSARLNRVYHFDSNNNRIN